jgi:hypothetical protein
MRRAGIEAEGPAPLMSGFYAQTGLPPDIAPLPKSADSVAKVVLLKVSKILRAAGAVFM